MHWHKQGLSIESLVWKMRVAGQSTFPSELAPSDDSARAAPFQRRNDAVLGVDMKIWIRKRDPLTDAVTYEDFSADPRLSVASDTCVTITDRSGGGVQSVALSMGV